METLPLAVLCLAQGEYSAFLKSSFINSLKMPISLVASSIKCGYENHLEKIVQEGQMPHKTKSCVACLTMRVACEYLFLDLYYGIFLLSLIFVH